MKKLGITIMFSAFALFAFGQQPSRFGDEDSTSTTQEVQEPESNTPNATTSSAKKRKQKSPFLEKTRFGGNVGFSFGSYTYIELSPKMYYLLQDNLGLGLGFSYYYWKNNNAPPQGVTGYKTSGNTYGLNMSVWYNPIGPLTLQAEYEPLNFDVYQGLDVVNNRYIYEREWVHGLLLGGGIRQQSGRVNMFVMVLYNVLYDSQRTFYSSPWVIRIGAGF